MRAYLVLLEVMVDRVEVKSQCCPELRELRERALWRIEQLVL